MPFEVHPSPPFAPLELGPGATSELIRFEPRFAAGPEPVMFLRVALSADAPAPAVSLQADGGPEVLLTAGTAQPVQGGPPENPQVADATVDAEEGGVYLVRVFQARAAAEWRVRLRNNDPVQSRRFTWVVADSDAEARQPWLHAPGELAFQAKTGTAQTLELPVANCGTGDLRISDTVGRQLGPTFRLDGVPAPVGAGASGAIRVTFNAPEAPGETTADYAIGSNDASAQPGSAGHNSRVRLRGLSAHPPPVLAAPPEEFAPRVGLIGDLVTLRGRNLAPVPNGTRVAFGGSPAEVTAAAATEVVARVPLRPGGPVQLSLTTEDGTTASRTPFRILSPAVAPGFHVYPDPPHAPLEIAAGAVSEPVPLAELAGREEGLDVLYLRLNMLGRAGALQGGGDQPAGAPAPTRLLRADDGDEVALRPGATAAIFSRPGGAGAEAANATLQPEGGGLHLVRLFLHERGKRWQLRLKNNVPSGPRGFVWVVARSDAEARQPWIEMPGELAFKTNLSQSFTRALPIINRGTGVLQITDRPGTALGGGFTLVEVPGPIAPNAVGHARLRFDGLTTPGEVRSLYAPASNDVAASEVGMVAMILEHNGDSVLCHTRFLTLRARVGLDQTALAPPPNEFTPPHGPPGSLVTLQGTHLDGPVRRVLAMLGTGGGRSLEIVRQSESELVVRLPHDLCQPHGFWLEILGDPARSQTQFACL